MRKLLLLVVLSLPLALGTAGATSGDAARRGTIWVTERSAHTVTAFDAATGRVLGTTAVGSTPIGITRPSGTGKVYSSDEGSNQLSVIDAETVSVLKTIPMGPRPHHLMASANGDFVYVAEFGSNLVGVVNTARDSRVAGWEASASGAARTHAVWITKGRRALYATNEVVNSIAKLDGRTGARLWEIPIGDRPSEILVTPSGKKAFVSVRNENLIKVVDVSRASPAVVDEIRIGTQPDTLSLTPDGTTLVVGLRGTPATMALMDTKTLAVRHVSLSGTTTGHQWLSADGRYTFIAVESPGGVATVDNRAGGQVGFYPYPGGAPRPHGVFFDSQR